MCLSLFVRATDAGGDPQDWGPASGKRHCSIGAGGSHRPPSAQIPSACCSPAYWSSTERPTRAAPSGGTNNSADAALSQRAPAPRRARQRASRRTGADRSLHPPTHDITPNVCGALAGTGRPLLQGTHQSAKSTWRRPAVPRGTFAGMTYMKYPLSLRSLRHWQLTDSQGNRGTPWVDC